MRKFSLSRPYLGIWLLQYAVLWSATFTHYPDSLKMTLGVIFVVTALMAVPWVFLSLQGIYEIGRHVRHTRRASRKARRQRLSRLPAATPSAARRREPRRTSTTLPDIRPASASLQGPELPRVTWMLAGHVLKAYIMRPHLSTTAIHAVNGNYVLASEHGQGARSAQYYQDQALGYLAAYATEQHPGFIPPDTSRYLLEKAHQACRTLVIKQATAPESVIEVTEACYQALSQQAEQLVQQFAPTLRTIAEELDASERRHDLRLDEATLATFFARLDHGLPRPVDAAA